MCKFKNIHVSSSTRVSVIDLGALLVTFIRFSLKFGMYDQEIICLNSKKISHKI